MKDIFITCFMVLVPLVAVCLAAFLSYNDVSGWWAFLLVPMLTSVRYKDDNKVKE
jgi:hypothetical protein